MNTFSGGYLAAQLSFETDDAIVLLLGAPTKLSSLNGKIAGITKLEKLVFLFGEQTTWGKLVADEFDFRAHNFGPFSSKVYQAVGVLEAYKLIADTTRLSKTNEDSWETENIIGEQMGAPYTIRHFELTNLGHQYYHTLRADFLNDESEKDICEFMEMFGAVPLRQLVRYIHNRYPNFTENSLIHDQVL